MKQNIVRILQQRETDSSSYKNFPAKNYFSAGIMSRMELENTLPLEDNSDFDHSQVKYLSWNGGSGEVLAYGQPNIEVKLLKPFGGEEVVSGVAAEEGEFVADAKFMPSFENLLAVGTRGSSLVKFISEVKLWDVQRGLLPSTSFTSCCRKWSPAPRFPTTSGSTWPGKHR